MNFGQALEELKNGRKIARQGWNGKGMWLTLVTGYNIDYTHINNDDTIGLHRFVAMKGADNKLFPWNPNNLDMLAEDWNLIL